ncbi:MAG: 30S ribosomal protein S18 [Candidatus Atribacteria bacterium]|nr:30S ribosomal protein S18 [Candidatus Atribacteria bacterium]
MRPERDTGKKFFRKTRKRNCVFCVEKGSVDIDYKDINRLGRFISERGKIVPKRVTSVCAKHQRGLSRAIKRAREIGFLPYALD